MAELFPTITQTAVVATALKILLFPAYRSTDFEVHRNWLALTHSLPVREWYYESTSQWTLDYPPFFAYFEWLLSQAARFVDPLMLQVSNLEYDSWSTICFQRSTVIVADFCLAYALHKFVQSAPPSQKKASHAAALSILLSPALLIIDHIHFQYNGFLYGILILSIVFLRKQSTMPVGAFLFATVLCLKHIYLYLAPPFFVYLLRAYCLSQKSILRVRFANSAKLAIVVAGVFGSAFVPFWNWAQLDQLRQRLFPFTRGLCHAYWAPNIWSIYAFTDRVLILLASLLRWDVDRSALTSATRGLVGDSAFAVLPNVSPRTTFLLTVGFQTLPLVKLFSVPTWDNFVGALTLCGFASFLFGWHVHEKAILLVVIPFSFMAIKDRRYLGAFRPLAVAAHVSLFPLLFTAAEFPIKTTYTILWLTVFLLAFDRIVPVSSKPRIFVLDRFALLYITVSVPLILYCSVVHGLIFGASYEFLPLMFTSSYSAIGVVGGWIGFSVVYFSS